MTDWCQSVFIQSKAGADAGDNDGAGNDAGNDEDAGNDDDAGGSNNAALNRGLSFITLAAGASLILCM